MISIHALLAESDYSHYKILSTRSKFLSTLSLRRATAGPDCQRAGPGISIHALLAESDALVPHQQKCGDGFLSTLSLRRATVFAARQPAVRVFLSTLSLRRATTRPMPAVTRVANFYPRSPCGERRGAANCYLDNIISIHALLAESDALVWCSSGGAFDFYPRSPCGERLNCSRNGFAMRYFYPRSPCGERRHRAVNVQSPTAFLSTLSLRRATLAVAFMTCPLPDFYPRSPCGERPPPQPPQGKSSKKFLSTLSLRRATKHQSRGVSRQKISIHALLAESDGASWLPCLR